MLRHFHGLYSHRPWLSTIQRARIRSVIVKTHMAYIREYFPGSKAYHTYSDPKMFWYTLFKRSKASMQDIQVSSSSPRKMEADDHKFSLRKRPTFLDTTTVSLRNDVWAATAEIPYWWHDTTQIWKVLLLGRVARKLALTNQWHYPDMGSVASSVWNFCARFLDGISQGNQWRRREMSAVFPGYRKARLAYTIHSTSNSLLLRRFVFRMAEASAKRVTGDEPQGTMGRVQTAGTHIFIKREVSGYEAATSNT